MDQDINLKDKIMRFVMTLLALLTTSSTFASQALADLHVPPVPPYVRCSFNGGKVQYSFTISQKVDWANGQEVTVDYASDGSLPRNYRTGKEMKNFFVHLGAGRTSFWYGYQPHGMPGTLFQIPFDVTSAHAGQDLPAEASNDVSGKGTCRFTFEK